MSSESHQSQHREELGHLSCSFLHEYVYICAYLMPTEKLSVFISKWLIMLLYNRGHRKSAAGTNLSGMVVRWRFAGVFCRENRIFFRFLMFSSPSKSLQTSEWVIPPAKDLSNAQEQMCTFKARLQGHCHHCTEFCAVYPETAIFHTQGLTTPDTAKGSFA